MHRKRRKIEFYRYVFIAPSLAFFTFALIIPFVMGINISLTDWNGITRDYNYIGLDNFIKVFSDERVITPIRTSLLYGLIGVICNNVLTLSLALMVNQKLFISRPARLIFFLPTCLSGSLSAFAWNYIYREVFSSVFGVQSPLGKPAYVIPAIIAIILWNSSGVNMLIYLSALKGVPMDLYEAATVDGAGPLTKFRHVTIPMIVPAFTVCITLTLTSYLREFGTTLAATGGGPARASETISIFIYRNLYEFNKAGYGQACSILLMGLLMIIGSTVSTFLRNREVTL